MKAAVFYEHGGPEVVRVEEVERPEPGPGEARVRVRAAAMNHLDLWTRRGLPIEIALPHIGGSDIAGEVDALGPGSEGVEIGERVVVDPSVSCGRCAACRRGSVLYCPDYKIIGEHLPGGFAEYVVVPAANLYPVPDDLPFDRAAAAPLTFLTAWRGMITRGRLRAGEDVLITGASGGVSTAAIQIAKYAGARVFAVTTAGNVERVRALGADFVYDRNAVDFSREVWYETGKRGVDLTLDSVGTAFWRQNLRALTRGGRIVVYGATTGPQVETDLRLVFAKQLEIVGTSMAEPAEFREVMKLIVRGVLTPVIDVVWPLDCAAEAHRRLEEGQQFGSIVLVP